MQRKQSSYRLLRWRRPKSHWLRVSCSIIKTSALSENHKCYSVVQAYNEPEAPSDGCRCQLKLLPVCVRRPLPHSFTPILFPSLLSLIQTALLTCSPSLTLLVTAVSGKMASTWGTSLLVSRPPSGPISSLSCWMRETTAKYSGKSVEMMRRILFFSNSSWLSRSADTKGWKDRKWRRGR